MKRPARVPSQVSESLHRRLNAYALAASAAGVSALAVAQPAQARIVYTPTHHVITFGHPYDLDVNNDGRRDFRLSNGATTGGTSCGNSSGMAADGLRSGYNSIVGKDISFHQSASALRAGVPIGAANQSRGNMAVVKYNFCSKTSRFYGQWANGGKGVKNRYLGLKFYIGKQAHYGWARLNFAVLHHEPEFKATLTGYAYETIPNKPIIAGQTHGRDDAILGRLAQGASGLSNGGKP
jgi:hypothetical protein